MRMENTLQMRTLQCPEQNKTEPYELTLKHGCKPLNKYSKALSATTTTTNGDMYFVREKLLKKRRFKEAPKERFYTGKQKKTHYPSKIVTNLETYSTAAE